MKDNKNKKEKQEENQSTKVDQVSLLKKEIAQLKKEIDEWKNKYLRALADYQNLEKRTISQISDFQKKANKNLWLKFLEIFDLIEKAEVFIKDPGLKMIKEKFLMIMKEEGVEELDLLGKPYNPYLAECIEVIKGKNDNIIIEVVRKGYRLNKEVIRVARVKVEKKVIS